METHKNDVILIGAGLSGLTTAHFLLKGNPGLRVVLLEADHRPGGAVETLRVDGYQCEWGPHGFLDNTEESQELLRDTGLYAEAQKAPLGDFYRYVCHGGALVRLPQSPVSVLTTPLVSPFGKLRALADLWRRPVDHDQSIGEWVAHRFGKAILPLVDAAVTGSFAGDYTRLSIDAVMPGVRRLEREHGSVVRGLLRKKKERAAGAPKKMLPSMMNFPAGMERLVKVLAHGKQILPGEAVTRIERLEADEGWRACSASGGVHHGRHLVLAVPVNQTLRLLQSYLPPPVQEIPVARIVNVALGLDASVCIPYGFGYLAPEREGRFTMGAMFTSHMFPDRAPAGLQLMEALVGGRRHPERLDLDDETIVANVLRDVGQLIPMSSQPVFARVLRPRHGIPQMEMDHPRLLDWRREVERRNPGLLICGFGWDGIGMNDMIKTAHRTAGALLAGAPQEAGPAKVKPVYF